ncbi:hypothetical protein Tco_0122148 [Tanacetum coccineum]
MTTIAQQIALDNALVALENQRGIGKGNMRINPGMKPKEPTYQVVLDALALITCYPAFLITADVPVIYMHQFWATVNKHNASYRFKIDNKRFYVIVEIDVRREDQQLYKFKEGYFLRLRLQDIEDMLLLLVQQKLTNLTIDERYDLNVALRMFTRRIIIQRRVEDLQLGVKSYQKKLNLINPDTLRLDLRKRTAYTAY